MFTKHNVIPNYFHVVRLHSWNGYCAVFPVAMVSHNLVELSIVFVLDQWKTVDGRIYSIAAMKAYFDSFWLAYSLMFR